MVQAGKATDGTIYSLLPLLDDEYFNRLVVIQTIKILSDVIIH